MTQPRWPACDPSDLPSTPWVARVSRAVADAAPDDHGTRLVAGILLSRATAEHLAERERFRAEEDARLQRLRAEEERHAAVQEEGRLRREERQEERRREKRWEIIVTVMEVVFFLALVAVFIAAMVHFFPRWTDTAGSVAATSSAAVSIYPFNSHDGKDYATCGLAEAVNGTSVRVKDGRYLQGGFNGGYVTVDEHYYYVWTGRSVGAGAPAGSCNLVVVFKDEERFRELNTGSQGVNHGSICDTDGTVEGLVWFVDSANQTDTSPGAARGYYYWRVAQTSANDPQFLTLDEFTQTFPMCPVR